MCATTRAFDRVGLQTQVDIAERHRMSRPRRAAHSRRQRRHAEHANAEKYGSAGSRALRSSVVSRSANGNVRPWRSARAPFIFARYLSAAEQPRARRVSAARSIDGAVPAYVPVVRGGGKMHVRMLCLGRHWNGKTYALRDAPQRLRQPAGAAAAGDVRAAGARHRARRRHDAGAGSLHPQLLRCRRPHGAAPGQGRERAIDRRRPAGRVGVARRHGAVSVRRAAAQGPGRDAPARVGRRVRLRRPGAPSLSRRLAHPSRAPRRPSSVSPGDST